MTGRRAWVGAAALLSAALAATPEPAAITAATPTEAARPTLLPRSPDSRALAARVRASRSKRPPARPSTRAVAGSTPPVSDRRAQRLAGSQPPTKLAIRPEPRTGVVGAARQTSKKSARTYDGRGIGLLDITAYCWTGNRNASGGWPQLGEVATLSRGIPFGTRLHIEGLGAYVVADRIGHSSDVDIYLGREGCYKRALTFGRKRLRVVVLP